ncbi:MAG: Cof-type HAD-IIB family hydrolase [Chitinophagales bacterium]
MKEAEATIRLVALDIDDTLLAPDLTIPGPSAAAVRAVLAQGTPVVLATGRMFRSALPYALELGVTLPLISYNGALVRDPAGETLAHQPVPLDLAHSVIRLCAQEDLTLNLYLDDDLFVARRTPEVAHYEEIAGLPAQEVGDLAGFLARRGGEPTKLLIVAAPEKAEELAARLGELHRGVLNVMRSRPRFVEIVREGVDKWWAVLAIAERLGVAPGEIMAMGDSRNDLLMLERAALSVTVPHAPGYLKAAADYVTEKDDGLGVAEALERFVLSRR